LFVHYKSVVKQDGEWWIGWIEEVPGVNCQEASREELIETLRITLQEALALDITSRREANGESPQVLRRVEGPQNWHLR
jgi:predicted RNase H-like HicB family nuclease